MAVALRDAGYQVDLDVLLLKEIADYFKEVRKKYHQYESAYSGVDTGVLINQVPGGIMSNLANQLKEQGALDRINEVFAEIPRVRKDLGFPPLVTPTSQIVGTQASVTKPSPMKSNSICKAAMGAHQARSMQTYWHIALVMKWCWRVDPLIY